MDRPFGKHRQDTFADRGHAGLKNGFGRGTGWGTRPRLFADTHSSSQSGVTGRWLQIALRTWLQPETDVEVFEVFSCEASEEAKQVVVACDFVTKPTRLRYRFCYA